MNLAKADCKERIEALNLKFDTTVKEHKTTVAKLVEQHNATLDSLKSEDADVI